MIDPLDTRNVLGLSLSAAMNAPGTYNVQLRSSLSPEETLSSHLTMHPPPFRSGRHTVWRVPYVMTARTCMSSARVSFRGCAGGL